MKIGYLVGEFPKLSETFIVDEIKEHLRNRVEVTVIAFFRPGRASPARANLNDVDINTVYIFRTTGLLSRVERLIIGILALATQWRLWKVMWKAELGSLWDRLNILGFAFRLRRRKELHDLDLLHCHFGHRGHYAAVLSSLGLMKAKIVTTFHGFDVSSVLTANGNRYYDLLFRVGHMFLPVSEVWARKLRQLGCDPKRIRVHRVGIDCSMNGFKERRPGTNMPVKLISIGRLVEKKGHAVTLRALHILRCRRADLAFSLDIVGEGPMESVLKSEAGNLGLDDLVTFHGGLPHVETLELLDRSSIFVLPSVTANDGDMEGIPVSLMEAMARGIPVVSTMHSGIPELVENGVSGLLVPEHDVQALAQALEYMIANPRRWADFGRAGRKRVETEFDRRKLGQRLREIYWGLLPRAAQ